MDRPERRHLLDVCRDRLRHDGPAPRALGSVSKSAETASATPVAPTRSGGTQGNLSNRELEILRLLADGKSPTVIAYKTVANQCTRIKDKLGLDRTADLIRFALENRGSSGVGVPEP